MASVQLAAALVSATSSLFLVSPQGLLLQLMVICIPDCSLAGKRLPDPIFRSRESRQDGLACEKTSVDN